MLNYIYLCFYTEILPQLPTIVNFSIKMVNVPKARNTYCARCNKHQKMKVKKQPSCWQGGRGHYTDMYWYPKF